MSQTLCTLVVFSIVVLIRALLQNPEISLKKKFDMKKFVLSMYVVFLYGTNTFCILMAWKKGTKPRNPRNESTVYT